MAARGISAIPESFLAVGAGSGLDAMGMMLCQSMLGRCLLGALLAAGAVPLRAEFVPPAELASPLRRDRLPLEVAAMRDLASRMVRLADALEPDTAAERRGAAQMLALAGALDPANEEIAGLIEAYRDGTHEPRAGASKPDLAPIEQQLDWLASDAAGAEGAKLAGCLKDVLAVAAPTHPRAAEWKAAGESRLWAGWVPVEGAYLDASSGSAADDGDPPLEPTGDSADKPEDDDAGGGEDGDPPGPTLLEQATLHAMMLVQVPRSDPPRWVTGVAELEMEASKADADRENPPAFELRIGPRHAEGRFRSLQQAVLELLRARHGSLPAGWRVEISGEALDELPQPSGDARKDREKTIALPAAACAVLADAALSGSAPDAVVLGEVDSEGRYSSSPKLWEQLRVLMESDPSDVPVKRVLLPDDAKGLMPSVFAYGHPSFFMDYEVLLAPDFATLAERASSKPPEAIAAPLAEFARVRQAAEGKDLRGFVIQKQVNQQLLALSQAAPFHFSARALTLNPNQWPREPAAVVVATDLAKALAPIARIVGNTNPANNDPRWLAELGAAIESCESAMKPFATFQRYTTGETRALLGLAAGAISELERFEQSVEGSMRKRRDDSESRTWAAKRRLDESYEAFLTAQAKVMGGGGEP